MNDWRLLFVIQREETEKLTRTEKNRRREKGKDGEGQRWKRHELKDLILPSVGLVEKFDYSTSSALPGFTTHG